MTAQLDLFGVVAPVQGVSHAPQPLPRASVPELLPAAPTLAWARLLAQSSVGQETIVLVSWLWAGEVVESLADPALGRQVLHRDGRIQPIAADPGARGRFVYLNPRLAQELHERYPMVLVAIAGTHSARFRFARLGERTVPELPLPPGCDEP